MYGNKSKVLGIGDLPWPRLPFLPLLTCSPTITGTDCVARTQRASGFPSLETLPVPAMLNSSPSSLIYQLHDLRQVGTTSLSLSLFIITKDVTILPCRLGQRVSKRA